MKVEIVKVERVQHATLMRGEYIGTWCGYVIEIPLQTEKWLLRTKDGVPTMGTCIMLLWAITFVGWLWREYALALLRKIKRECLDCPKCRKEANAEYYRKIFGASVKIVERVDKKPTVDLIDTLPVECSRYGKPWFYQI